MSIIYNGATINKVIYNNMNVNKIILNNVTTWEQAYEEYLTYTLLDDNTYAVSATDVDNMPAEIVIPSTYNGKAVASIADKAFQDCTNLINIVIPDSVTSIEDSAFKGCTSLEEITIPFVGQSKSATGYASVFGYIFGYATTTTNISTLNGVKFQYQSLQDDKNYYYHVPSSLKKVTVTGGNIPNRAFYNCSNITSIRIPDSATSIGYEAFRDCTSLTNIVIPDDVNSIPSNAFAYCSELELITVKEGNTAYHSKNNCLIETATNKLISGCKNDTIIIPDSVTTICDYAFSGFTGLTSITIPDSVKRIGGHAFSDCTGLTSIIIPNSVELVEMWSFYGCTSLEEITIPFVGQSKSDTKYASVFGYIFGCVQLTSRPTTHEGTYQYYDSSTESYCYYCIPDSLKKVTVTGENISDYAFQNCTRLTNITISDSVKSIGYHAFFNCAGLASITIPDSVTSIGDGAFSYCTGLTSVTIPDSVSSIGDGAFSYCTGLTIYCEASSQPDTWDENWNPDDRPVVWGTLAAAILGVGKLGTMKLGQRDPNSESEGLEYALTSDALSYSVTGIGTCEDTDIVIPSTYNGMSVTSVAENAFLDCTSLTGVTIGNNIASIGCGAFDGCTGLTSITIPDNVIEVIDCAFSNCTGLASATIGSGVTRIEDDVFYNCTGLISIVIPDNVIRIDGGAFGNCTSLTSITIGSGVTYIGDSTFYGCTNLVDVYYNGTTTEWSNISIEADNECLTNATLHTAGYALSITFSSSGHYNVGSGAYSVAPCGSISGTAPETIADGETAKITIAPRQIMGASTTTAAYLDLTVSACTNATYNLVASTSSYSYTLYITPTGAGDISVIIMEDTSEDED